MTDTTEQTSLPVITSETEQIVPNKTIKSDWQRYLIIFSLALPVLICIAFGFLKLISAVLEIITPFLVALAIALILDPVVDWMEKRGIRRTFSVAIVFALFIGGLIFIAITGLPAIVSQASSLASNSTAYIGKTTAGINQFLSEDHVIAGFRCHPAKPGIWIVTLHEKRVWKFQLPENFNVLSQQVATQLGTFLQRSTGAMTAVLLGSVSTVFDMLIILIVGFYLLVDIDRIRARFFFLIPEKYRKKVEQMGQDIGQVFADYLRGLVIVCALYGVCTTIMLYGLAFMPQFGHTGLAQYALLIGVSAGVLYAIPYLGSLSIALVTFLVALAAGGPGFGAIAVFATFIVNQTFDNIIAPRVIGGGVGLNPVLAIFSLSLGGVLWGFWGLLLSVPIAASVQVILFRLIPKLTMPTPSAFLEAHGVADHQGTSTKIMKDAPRDVKAKKSEKRQEEEIQLDKDIAAENRQAPK